MKGPSLKSESCFICGDNRPNGLETHHIIPQAVGGSDEPENLVNLCASCHGAISKIYTPDVFKRAADNSGQYPSWTEEDDYPTGDKYTLDREIPLDSPHVLFESVIAGSEYMDEPHTRHVEVDELENQRKTRREPDEDNLIPDWSRAEFRKESWTTERHELWRIHCGYCNAHFEKYQHAKAARHLRLRHHIENPYEEKNRENAFSAPRLFRDE